jgi:predicted O-methyltransferase YrrM
MADRRQSEDLSSGAHPTSTFPNAHLAHAPTTPSKQEAGWAPPEASTHSPVEELRAAVDAEDWAKIFSEGKTKMHAESKWSATQERCAALQCLCTLHHANRVLEIGSFCGAAALAMAESVPKDGEVVALELEPFFVEFGQKYRIKSQAGSRITTKVGPAMDSLKELLEEQKREDAKSFDLVVIDGDKASMKEYFDMVRTPGFLSRKAVVCMDITPFKGQLPTRFVKFGAEEMWKASSGEQEIAALRAAVTAMPHYVSHEFGGLLVIQHRPSE